MYLDIEWNSCSNYRISSKDEIIEIGAVIVDDTSASHFYELVKPKRTVSAATLNLLGIKEADLYKGKNIDQVILEWANIESKCDFIILWSSNSMEMLKMVCKQHEIKIDWKRYIVFQQVLGKIYDNEGEISFENALINCGALYNAAYMHDALYDARCLHSLARAVEKSYEEFLINSDENVLVRNNRSGKVHKSSCTYAGKVDFDCEISMTELIDSRRICKHCLGMAGKMPSITTKKAKVKSYEGKRIDEKMTGEIARHFKLHHQFIGDYVLVTTKYSVWRIYYMNGYVIRLCHENYKTKANTNHMGFHNHEITKNDMYSVMRYIAFHDKNPHKKTRDKDWEKMTKRNEKKKKLQKMRRQTRDDEELEYLRYFKKGCIN